jgi:hypothetical protein
MWVATLAAFSGRPGLVRPGFADPAGGGHSPLKMSATDFSS